MKSIDAQAAKAVKGVTDVVEIPRGVAVVAQTMWAAIKGREALKVEWDESGAEQRGSDAAAGGVQVGAEPAGSAVARSDGDVSAALAAAPKRIEAVFEFPYLAHAALEPLNAVAWRRR